MPSKPYNGHPSYEHWNASLWVGNDEGLYGLCMEADTAQDAADLLVQAYPITGDDVEMTPRLALYAAKAARGEAK